MNNRLAIKRLLFFWISSFLLAYILYYALRLITFGNPVFGSFYRMICYHFGSPLQYIAIPCFFYGILATLFTNRFKNKKTVGRIGIIFLIIILTILLSSPFGGMLWHFHDMKAGYFPENWISKMMKQGFLDGLGIGWFIILLSMPYNIFGSIICFYLTKKGVEFYSEKSI